MHPLGRPDPIAFEGLSAGGGDPALAAHRVC